MRVHTSNCRSLISGSKLIDTALRAFARDQGYSLSNTGGGVWTLHRGVIKRASGFYDPTEITCTYDDVGESLKVDASCNTFFGTGKGRVTRVVESVFEAAEIESGSAGKSASDLSPLPEVRHMTESKSNNRLFWALLGLVALILWITNPSKDAYSRVLANDGWVPTNRDRTNLGLLSYESVTGFTGATAVYVGIGGQVMKITESD